MGRYTDRSRGWEIMNSFIVFLSLFVVCGLSFGLFGILVMLGISKKVSYSNWLKQCAIVIVLNVILFFVMLFLMITYRLEVTLFLMVVSTYGFIMLMAFHLREYLERLDLSNYMVLEENVSYSYRDMKDYFMSLESVKESEKSKFLRMMLLYKEQINNVSMKDDLVELVRLAELIIEKDIDRGDLFFLKHSSSIESILKQYVQLQNLGFHDTDTIRLSDKLVNVISLSRKAFENELINMFDNEVLSMTSEADFYKKYVQSKGLL